MSDTGRPGGVTFVGILIIIAGILSVLGGILGLLSADARAGLGIITLILTLVIGIIYLAVARGIFDGNNFSRLLVALVSVINLVVGVIHLIFVSGMRWNGLVSAIFALIILSLLYSRRASAFFASR